MTIIYLNVWALPFSSSKKAVPYKKQSRIQGLFQWFSSGWFFIFWARNISSIYLPSIFQAFPAWLRLYFWSFMWFMFSSWWLICCDLSDTFFGCFASFQWLWRTIWRMGNFCSRKQMTLFFFYWVSALLVEVAIYYFSRMVFNFH